MKSRPESKDPILLDSFTFEDKARLQETWPIMSTSKAFCGALVVANAREYFGEKGVKSTIREALEFSKIQNPDRAGKIDNLITSLEKAGAADLQIGKILNHTAGLDNNNKAYWQNPKYQALDQNSYFSEMEVKKESGFSYSNNGYYLLEELVNLTSQSGDYHQEMVEKIFKPLELSQTKFLSEATAEERSRVGDGGFVMPYPNSFTTGTYEETYPIRNLSAAAGGLMSSGNDLKKFFSEYTKMILGENNAITKSPDPSIAKLYQEMLTPVREGSNEYFSLGITIIEKGGRLLVDEKLLVGHDGGHASNSCHARVIIDGTIEDFKSGSLKQDKISGFEFDVNKSSAVAGMLKYAVLFHVMEGYFKEKISTLDKDQQKLINQKLTPEKIGELTKLGLLPNNFKDFEREILDITKKVYLDHLKKGFLNQDGAVDEKKLAEAYGKDKQGFYDQVLSDSETKEKIADIFTRCDLEMTKKPREEKQGSFAAKIGSKTTNTQESWVKRTESNSVKTSREYNER